MDSSRSTNVDAPTHPEAPTVATGGLHGEPSHSGLSEAERKTRREKRFGTSSGGLDSEPPSVVPITAISVDPLTKDEAAAPDHADQSSDSDGSETPAIEKFRKGCLPMEGDGGDMEVRHEPGSVRSGYDYKSPGVSSRIDSIESAAR